MTASETGSTPATGRCSACCRSCGADRSSSTAWCCGIAAVHAGVPARGAGRDHPAAVAWLYGIRFPKGISGWKPFFAIGLFNNVLPFSLIVIGQTYIPSGLASILNATTPLFTVVVMAAAGEEKLSRAADRRRRRRPDRRDHPARRWHLGFESGQGLGILLCLAGAFSYGMSALLARRLLSNSPPLGDRDVPDAGLDR